MTQLILTEKYELHRVIIHESEPTHQASIDCWCEPTQNDPEPGQAVIWLHRSHRG